jgi:hypothetical protein
LLVLPKVEVIDAVFLGDYAPLLRRLDRMRRHLSQPRALASLVPAIRSDLESRFEAIYPQLHRSGRLRASLTRRTADGYAELARRDGEAAVEVGSTVPYADAANVWPRLRDLVMGEQALGRAAEEYAQLVQQDIVAED